MKQIISTLVLTTGCFLAAPTYADSKAFVVGGLGQAKYKTDSDSETATSFLIGGGYKFNENFAVEARYEDFGEIKDSETEADFMFTSKVASNAYTLSVIGGLPINESFNLFAKVGVGFWDIDISSSERDTITNNRFSDKISFSDNDFVYGFGAEYTVNDQFGITAEYTSLNIDYKETQTIGDVSSTTELDVDINNLVVSARFYF